MRYISLRLTTTLTMTLRLSSSMDRVSFGVMVTTEDNYFPLDVSPDPRHRYVSQWKSTSIELAKKTLHPYVRQINNLKPSPIENFSLSLRHGRSSKTIVQFGSAKWHTHYLQFFSLF